MSKKLPCCRKNLRCASLPCRPPTRRHPFETPANIKIRSVSAIVTSRKDVNTPLYYALNTIYKHNEELVMRGRFLKEIAKFKKQVKSANSSEFQYSKFILNAINEIIKKRIITIDRIYLTFLKHMEENREQFELVKMIDELKQFCLSVRIPFNENLYMLSVNSVEKQGGDIPFNIIHSPSDKDSLSRLTERTEPVSVDGDFNDISQTESLQNSIDLNCFSAEKLPGLEPLADVSVQVSKNKMSGSTLTTMATQTENCYLKPTPIIKINLKNLALTEDDYIVLECPVYLPKLILEKTRQNKSNCNVDDMRIDASVSKVGVKKATVFKK